MGPKRTCEGKKLVLESLRDFSVTVRAEKWMQISLELLQNEVKAGNLQNVEEILKRQSYLVNQTDKNGSSVLFSMPISFSFCVC